MAARIVGLGKYLPERVLTNAELERMVDTNDQWIVERTGIRERRIAADDEGPASMGTKAARQALATAGLQPDDIDLIICATCTGDGMFPASASLIQDALGARHAGAFDINAVCAGFIASLGTAVQFINSGSYQRVLVVGADVLSRIVNWQDRGTCILFGDGAGAVVLERAESGGVGSIVLRSDGSGARFLYANGPTTPPRSPLEAEGYYMVMDGREVYRFAVRAMEEASRQAIADAGLTPDDITLVVPHQANLRIIAAVAKALAVPMERVVCNLDRYGNTSAATIPVALCEAYEEGRVKPGDRLLFVAFGGGLVWGASVVEWTGLGSCLRQANAGPSTVEVSS
jgi:3-oxoacyl-[acyl-carrier-protein] synthase-3